MKKGYNIEVNTVDVRNIKNASSKISYPHSPQVTVFDDLTTSTIKMADMKDDPYQHSVNQFY